MGLGHSPVIDTSSLQLLLDAANVKSYAGSGTTWTDLSGNGRNFTLVSGPYESPGYLGSMYFDGVDDYATSSYAPVFTGDFTISFWVNFKTYNTYQNVISSSNNTGAAYGFWVEFGTARGFQLFTGIAGTGTLALDDNVVNVQSLTTNAWHHVCITRSGSSTNNLKVYVDNVLVGQNTYTTTIGVATQNLMIAKYSYDYSSLLFNGYLSNLVIQHAAVSSDTIARNYAAGRGRFDNFYSAPIDTTSLVLNLDAGNPSSYSGSGTTWTSLTGTNNATLQNGPTFDTANGGTIAFDGTNDYASCASSSDFAFGTGDFTCEMWIKHGTSGSAYQHLFALPDQNTFGLKAYDGGTYGAIYFYSSAFRSDTSGIDNSTINGWALDRNIWNHIVFVRENSVAYGYKNTVLKGTKSGFTSNFSAQTLNIGWGYGSEYRSKNIAVARIWKRALSQAEITSSFNALRGRFGL